LKLKISEKQKEVEAAEESAVTQLELEKARLNKKKAKALAETDAEIGKIRAGVDTYKERLVGLKDRIVRHEKVAEVKKEEANLAVLRQQVKESKDLVETAESRAAKIIKDARAVGKKRKDKLTTEVKSLRDKLSKALNGEV